MSLKLQEEYSRIDEQRKATENRLTKIKQACESGPVMKLPSGLTLVIKVDTNAKIRLGLKKQNSYNECEIELNEIDALITSLEHSKIIGNMSEEEILTYGQTDNILKKITEMEMKK